MSRPRRAATVIHRYTGLVLALFLTITGLTGAVIAWNDELERVFAPSLFVLPAASVGKPALDIFTLRDIAERVSGGAVNGVDWTRARAGPARFSVEARPGRPAPADDEIALDPATGRLLGARRYGDISQGAINTMGVIYELHASLLLGPTGTLILGIAALLWTIDCFVGAYLTFPARARTRRSAPAWLTRWWPSWRVRWRAGGYRLLYDLHRAGGLWPWALLFILAWSSVGFNLPQVYRPVMALLGTAAEAPASPARDPNVPPRLGWRAAHVRAQTLMARAAARERFEVRSERLMFYDPATHGYAYRVLSDRDPGVTGNTQIRFDGDTGRPLALDIPTGRAAGTTIDAWLGDLHVADVFGVTMKIILTLVGLAVAVLPVTGVLIWWRKRNPKKRAVTI